MTDMETGAQIEIGLMKFNQPSTRWQKLNIFLLDGIAIISIAILAWGLFYTDVLRSIYWYPAVTRSFVGTLVVSLCLTIGACLVEKFLHVSYHVLIATSLALLSVVVFGPASVAVVALVLGSALISGTFVAGASNSRHDGPIAQRLSVGLAILAIILTLASWRHVNFIWFQMALLVCLSAPVGKTVVRRQLLADWTSLASAFAPTTGSWRVIWRAFGTFLAIFFMLQAALPERYADALAVHLYVGSYSAAHGQWAYDPALNAYSLMPLGADFLFAGLYLLGGEPAAKLINYAIFLIILSLIYGTTSAKFGGFAGTIAALLYASLPLTLIETTSVFIENPLTMWITTGACILFQRGRQLSFRAAVSILIVLAAATLSKVHGGIAACMLGVLMAGFYLSQKRSLVEYLGLIVLTVLIGGIALSPYIQAYRIAGNPFFPFYNDIFKSPFYAIVRFVDERWIGNFNFDLLYQATFHSSKFLEAYDGALGFSLMAFLVPALAAVVMHRSGLKLLGLVLVAFVVTIGWNMQYLRYFYPILPVAFLLIGFVSAIYLSRPRAYVAFNVAVAAVLCLNVSRLGTGGWILNDYDFGVLFSVKDARQFEQAAVPEKTLFRIVNQLQGPDARILLSGVNAAAPLEGTALYTGWYSKDYRDLGGRVATVADIEAYLRRVNPTYIVHRSPSAPADGFHAQLDANIDRFGRQVATIGGVSLYEVHLP